MFTLTRESFQDEKNQHVLVHWHNHIELIRVVEGSMECRIDGKEFELGEGDICAVNFKHPHRIHSEGDARFLQLTIDSSLFTADKAIFTKYIEPLLSDSAASHVISTGNSAVAHEIAALMEAIQDLEEKKPDAYELAVIAHLHLIFQRLYSLFHSRASDPVGYDIILFRKMADFIYANYQEKISLEEIASVGNVSKSKCTGIFKKYAQHTPVDYLNLYRLETGARMLKETDGSISSIAFACGFGQQSYFNRLFLREYGMTPKEYRNRK